MDINHYRTLVLAIFDAYLENPEKRQNDGYPKVLEGKSAFVEYCTQQGDSLTLGQIKDYLISTKGSYVSDTLQATGLSMVTSGRGTFLRLHLEPLIEYLEQVLAQLTQSQQSTARANALLAQLAQNYGWNTPRQNGFLSQFKHPTPLTVQEHQALEQKADELINQLLLAQQQREAEQRETQRLQQILEPQTNQIAGLLHTKAKQAEQLEALSAQRAEKQAQIDQLTRDKTELARQNSLLQETEHQATEQAAKLLQKCTDQDGIIAALTEQLKRDKIVMAKQEQEAANLTQQIQIQAQKHEALATKITQLRREVSRLSGEHRVDIPEPAGATVFSFWQTMSDPDSTNPDSTNTVSRRHFPGKL